MTDQYVGEIRMFAGNFAPVGWAFCNGQILPISQNTALFSLLGTNYGGNGTSTFGLPNLQGMAPMHWGQGPGLTNHEVGETGGEAQVALTIGQLPPHQHPILLTTVPDTTGTPSAGVALGPSLTMGSNPATLLYGAPTDMAMMASQSVGGGQVHDNRQPYLAVSFIIALQGVFPPRS
jgi:microcystin-dependent protein